MFTQLAFLVYSVKLNQFRTYMREKGPEIKTTEVQQRKSLFTTRSRNSLESRWQRFYMLQALILVRNNNKKNGTKK